MPRPRDVDYLQPSETASDQQRRHGASIADGIVAIVVALGLVWTAAMIVQGEVADATGPAWTVAILATLAAVAGLLALHWRRATSLFTVTDERVYAAWGRIRFTMVQTTYDKVTDLHLHQSIFGRIFGYGTVRVQTAGTGLAMPGVRDPVALKQHIESARAAFIDRLVGEHAHQTSHTGPPIAEPAGPIEPVWTGRPAAASLLGGLIGAGIMALGAIVAIVVGALVAGEAMLAGAAIFLGALAVAAGQIITFRYTHFEVSRRGVALSKGWLSRRRIEATYAKVTDVAVEQDILGRLLGYGKITMNTAGSNEAPVSFAGVADPNAVKAIIDAQRQDA